MPMVYPKELLPDTKYFKEIETDNVLKHHPEIHILRKSSSDNVVDPNDIKVRDICLNAKDVFGLSTYLFGNYKVEHVKYKAIERPLEDYWSDSTQCLSPTNIKYVEEPANIIPIYFEIKSLHLYAFPMHKKGEDGKKITETINGMVHVIHKPTNTNYWHFELIVKDQDGKEYERDTDGKKNFVKRAAEAFLETHLKHIANASCHPPESIKPEIYTRDVKSVSPILKLMLNWLPFSLLKFLKIESLLT
jgi:hypothetical protein